MKENKLKYSDEILADIHRLFVFATNQHTADFAREYTVRIRKEIEEPSILAGIFHESRFRTSPIAPSTREDNVYRQP